MKTVKKLMDRPFLSKFDKVPAYFLSKEEVYESIIREIKNILEANLKSTTRSPFEYGTKDIQSIETSNSGIEKFKEHCRETILKLEPRLREVEITEINIDKERQEIKIRIIGHLKKDREGEIKTEIKIVNKG